MLLREREEISRGLAAGRSMRQIADALGRPPSTVSREVARNGGHDAYRAYDADRRVAAVLQRFRCFLLRREPRDATLRCGGVRGAATGSSRCEPSSPLSRCDLRSSVRALRGRRSTKPRPPPAARRSGTRCSVGRADWCLPCRLAGAWARSSVVHRSRRRRRCRFSARSGG
ncbi:helix-turn-helix domain-containing protein [Cellulomonas sp. P22]|uniref:helix-turn-helix domain-containing protein n=1 Tax=Cellulomonas sp. P22 TaxID=3373189 RepID=UPI00379B6845